MSQKVFISYSHNDEEQANAVCTRFESADIKCWMAPRDISPSKDWAEEIIDAINSAQVMVLIFSSSSNTSPQVRREIERAVHKGLNILPFRIEDVAPSKSLEYFISTQHWLDASSGSFELHLDKLYNCVKALIEGNVMPCSAEVLESKSERTIAIEKSDSQASSFSASDLKHIAESLANHLGPMAKIVVNQTAAQSATLKDLVQQLSDELDNDKERDHFIHVCQSKVTDIV